MAKKILILVGDYSEDYEVMCSYVTLKAVGHTVHVASPGKKAGESIRTSIHEFEFADEHNYSEKPGHRFRLNATLADLRPEDYDGIFCPGGRGAEYIRTTPPVRAIVQYFAKAGKPICSICNGLQVLTDAGVVNGKTVIGYPDHRADAERAGARWADVQIVRGETEDRAIVDGNFVTGGVWGCLPSTLAAFLTLLGTTIQA